MSNIVMALVLALSTYLAPTSFTINGTVKGFGDGSFLILYNNGNEYLSDSVAVKNDKFSYTSSSTDPVYIQFIPNENAACNKYKTYSMSVVACNGNTPITVEADVQKGLQHAIVSNSPSHTEYMRIVNSQPFVMLAEKSNAYAKVSNSKNAIASAITDAKKELEKAQADAISHLTSSPNFATSKPATLVTFKYLTSLDDDKLEALVNQFDSSLVTSSPYLKTLKDNISRNRKIQEGNIAPAFTLYDTAGKAYTLEQYRGKMVLLYFTASWCSWCKKEKPYLERIRQEIPKDDLEIIAVYLDKDRTKWVNEVKNYPESWPMLSDMKDWQKDGIAHKYNVDGIPMIYLIDKDGTFLSKGTRRDSTLSVVKLHLK